MNSDFHPCFNRWILPVQKEHQNIPQKSVICSSSSHLQIAHNYTWQMWNAVLKSNFYIYYYLYSFTAHAIKFPNKWVWIYIVRQGKIIRSTDIGTPGWFTSNSSSDLKRSQTKAKKLWISISPTMKSKKTRDTKTQSITSFANHQLLFH